MVVFPIKANIPNIIAVARNTNANELAVYITNIPVKLNPVNRQYAMYSIFAVVGFILGILTEITIASTISNIANILNSATENSLILIDELGAGTDPVQGANLAISILQELYERNCNNK